MIDQWNTFLLGKFKNFFMGVFYILIYLKNKVGKKFELNQNSLLQYLWMSRVMDDATHDNFSKYLMPASILSVNNYEKKYKSIFTKFHKNKKKKKKQVKNILDCFHNL